MLSRSLPPLGGVPVQICHTLPGPNGVPYQACTVVLYPWPALLAARSTAGEVRERAGTPQSVADDLARLALVRAAAAALSDPATAQQLAKAADEASAEFGKALPDGFGDLDARLAFDRIQSAGEA